MADQVLSGASNILAVVLVARVVSAEDFGRFALSYTVLTLTLGLSRAYFGTRLSLAAENEVAQQLTGALVAALALMSPLIVLAVLTVSFAANGGHSFGIILFVAVVTPVVCMQDIVRFGAIVAGRPTLALVSDGLWVVVMVMPFVVDLALTPLSVLALWGGGAVAALCVALALLGEKPRVRVGIGELRRVDRMGSSVAVGLVMMTAASVCLLIVATRVIGPAAAGSLRGASTAMGPVNVVLAFTVVSVTSTLSRRPRAWDVQFCAITGVCLAALALIWGSVVVALPDEVGSAVFGASWPGIREVLPWTALEYIAVGVTAGAVLGLKVRGHARHLLALRLAGAASMVVLGGTAAMYARSAPSVAAAVAVAAALAALLGWLQLLTSRSRPPGQVECPPGRTGETAIM